MAEPNFPDATPEQIEDGKSLAWLSYLGWLCIIPLISHKDNPFSLYHARQGLLLAIAETVLVILASIFLALAGPWWTLIRVCLGLVGLVFLLALFAVSVLALIGLIQAIQGKFWKIPLIGDMADKMFKSQ